jgi:hypothetical protein
VNVVLVCTQSVATSFAISLGAVVLAGSNIAIAQQPTEELAKAAENPVAVIISVAFQNNTNFNVEPFNRTQDILKIQPVFPISLNPDWNLISRTTAPVMLQPSRTTNVDSFGLGDINETVYLSPVRPDAIWWDLDPPITVPTAINPILGTGKWLAGPSAVLLIKPGHWVVGALANNQWSFVGDSGRSSVNAGLIQPFVNYNFAAGWYLTSSPSSL